MFSDFPKAQSWNQLGTDIVGEGLADGFGFSLAISDDGRIFSGGSFTNSENGSRAGHVRIYEFDGTNWIQLGDDIDGEFPRDWSGSSHALSADGKIVAIGARLNDGNGSASGHARVFAFDGAKWNQLGEDINGENEADEAGYSVSLSADGKIIAISARDNSDVAFWAGHVRVFEFKDSIWTQLGSDIDGKLANERFGGSTSLSDDGLTLAIGTPTSNDNGNNSGEVRVFSFNGNDWVLKGNDIDGIGGASFGQDVSLSGDGNILAASSVPNDTARRGIVRVFKYDDGAKDWQQFGGDIVGETAGDRFGFSISLAKDGSIIAIGITFRGIGNSQSAPGQTRVYRFVDEDWNLWGNIIESENSKDRFGHAVALSADGNTVAASAIQNSEIIELAGHVQVYALESTTSATVGEGLHHKFEIFPNPSKDFLQIKPSANWISASSKVIIRNPSGLIVRKQDFSSGKITVADLAPGLYFLEVLSSNGRGIRRFVKW